MRGFRKLSPAIKAVLSARSFIPEEALRWLYADFAGLSPQLLESVRTETCRFQFVRDSQDSMPISIFKHLDQRTIIAGSFSISFCTWTALHRLYQCLNDSSTLIRVQSCSRPALCIVCSSGSFTLIFSSSRDEKLRLS